MSRESLHKVDSGNVETRIAADRPPCEPIRARWRVRAALAAFILCGSFYAGGTALAADDLPVRDPTRPPYAAGKGLVPKERDSSLLLVSTSVSNTSRSAVINDEVVTVGSRIGGAVVTTIEQGRVTLKRGAEAIVLQLFTPAVKRPAGDSS